MPSLARAEDIQSHATTSFKIFSPAPLPKWSRMWILNPCSCPMRGRICLVDLQSVHRKLVLTSSWARGFWSRQQDAFFDVRVTHPKASVLSRSEVLSQLKHHEQMKKRQYCARVNQIDRGTFTPLVFSTSCVCGPEANIFFKSLAAQLCEKHKDIRYSQAMGHLRSRLSVSLIPWAVTCFRGSRSSYKRYAGLTIAQACRQLL